MAQDEDFPEPGRETRIPPAVVFVVHAEGQLIQDPSAAPLIGGPNDLVDETHDPIVHVGVSPGSPDLPLVAQPASSSSLP